jgi:hypothetical protein
MTADCGPPTCKEREIEVSQLKALGAVADN